MTKHCGSGCHSSHVSSGATLLLFFFNLFIWKILTSFSTLFQWFVLHFLHTLWIFVNTAPGALCCPAVKVQLSYSLAQPMNKWLRHLWPLMFNDSESTSLCLPQTKCDWLDVNSQRLSASHWSIQTWVISAHFLNPGHPNYRIQGVFGWIWRLFIMEQPSRSNWVTHCEIGTESKALPFPQKSCAADPSQWILLQIEYDEVIRGFSLDSQPSAPLRMETGTI